MIFLDYSYKAYTEKPAEYLAEVPDDIWEHYSKGVIHVDWTVRDGQFVAITPIDQPLMMEKIREMSACRRNLSESDWVIAKISEAQAMGEDIEPLKQKYAEVLSMRRQWRARINELESQNDTQIQVN